MAASSAPALTATRPRERCPPRALLPMLRLPPRRYPSQPDLGAGVSARAKITAVKTAGRQRQDGSAEGMRCGTVPNGDDITRPRGEDSECGRAPEQPAGADRSRYPARPGRRRGILQASQCLLAVGDPAWALSAEVRVAARGDGAKEFPKRQIPAGELERSSGGPCRTEAG